MDETEKYPIMVRRDTMRMLINILEWVRTKIPKEMMPSYAWGFQRDLEDAYYRGCWKHNIMTENFKVDSMTTETWCQKCSPKEYRDAKKKAEEHKNR